jgi:DNA-binding NarL/FixJ family response regulator
MIRTAVADDHNLIRDGIKALAALDPEVDIIWDTGNVEELYRLMDEDPPDILILDITMDTYDAGLEILGGLHSRGSTANVLILSMHRTLPFIQKAISAGAKGYLTKSDASDHLLSAIRSVARGCFYLSPQAAELTLNRQPGLSEKLTKREREVLYLYSCGWSTAEIAAETGIRPSTVSTHIENIKIKLGFTKSSELKRAALQWLLEKHI